MSLKQREVFPIPEALLKVTMIRSLHPNQYASIQYRIGQCLIQLDSG
jgi:hypothetical protein